MYIPIGMDMAALLTIDFSCSQTVLAVPNNARKLDNIIIGQYGC